MKKLAILTVAALAACASQHQEAAKIDDSGLARLNEDQMAPVDDARIEVGRAQDAVARGKAAEADARAQVEVAKSDKAVAEAQLKRALAERDLLKKQYAGKDALARSDESVRASQERVKAADLKLQYLNQLVAVRETERKAAEAHVLTAQALTEQAKYRAMKEGKAPQADVVNPGDIDHRVASARSQEANLEKSAADQRTKAVDLYNRWQQADASVRTMAQPTNLPVPPPVSEPTSH